MKKCYKMPKRIIFIHFLILLCGLCNCAYFDNQPKLLTENGNFVIESALDKNISFRLKGNSFININDKNIANFIGKMNQTSGSNSNLGLRLLNLEEKLRQFLPPEDETSKVTSNHNIWQRIITLEQQINDGSPNTTLTQLNRRVRNLETKLNRIVTRLNTNNCTSNPCSNGGTCTNTFNGYACRCSDAWTGVNCHEDVNECKRFADTDLGCQNYVTCENWPGGYTCRCKPGWLGIHCTKRTVDCSESSAYELCGHGVCVHTNDPTTYQCICDQGWISNGTSPACTTDVDECNSVRPHCSSDPEVPCINLPGSYTCGQCPQGFAGNGYYCTDIDECEINNGGCSLSPFVQCINTRGSSKCGQCPFGYNGDGRFCTRTVDFPASSPSQFAQRPCDRPTICHPLALCTQNTYTVTCICPPHYSGNGIGRFGCIQTNATMGACSGNPCQNGGTCENVGAFGYRCECPVGTVPPRCARSINICSPNPCQNGGVCVQLNRSLYRCLCPTGRTGRNCQIEVSSCGGVLNSFNGTLKYPLTGTYQHNSRCAWLIKTDEDKVLNVTFLKFQLEQSRECRYDWLQIHDGRSSSSYMIGRFCGTELPKHGRIITTQNMLYLWFRSDNSTSHDGFELTWNSIDPICGGDITISSHGIISSPGSPGNYPPNRDCIWKLTGPADKRIQLHFFTLQMEAHEDCLYDYLAIYNGPSTAGDLLEKFCNTTHPSPLTSPANELTLYFHSDADGTDSGFQIHYSLIEGIQGCGGTFTANNGEFGSPIQDGQYPKNLECHYLIKLPRRNETGIKLTFLSFNLESSSNCNFDYVEIYDGNNENAPKVGRWCGNRIPPEHTTQSGELLVVFHSDFSFGGEGFRLKYEILCGGRFDEESGVITSPLFPSPYENDKNCIYDIEGPIGKAIVLTFFEFDIENDCDFDSLSIYDGVDENSTLIGTYCGTRTPPVTTSTLNHLHLVFKTDSSNTGPGFRAIYSYIDAGCGGVIKKLNQTISPPMDDGHYRNDSNCKWIIVAPSGSIVELTFDSFDLANMNCHYDYIEIYDNIIISNATTTSPIGRYCGNAKPPITMSTSNALTIVFKSDPRFNGQGFLAKYDFIDARNQCGGNFYALSGTISSPNYPDQYPPSRDCVYVIHAPNGKQVQLQVKTFELEASNGCGFDSLEIRNGQNDKSPLMGTFCGTEILPRFKSFSNRIYIRFKSDSSNEHRGFQISYDTASSGCGGLFANTQSGTLTSPNYPEPYPVNIQCDYTIQVARGSTIRLELTDIDFEAAPFCSDYILIYDGPNAGSKLFGSYCYANDMTKLESTTNIIFIRFIADVSIQGRGFELKFSSNCQRTIHDIQGAIESPNFPSNYPHNVNCEWKIVPPPGNRIFLEFSHFELEHSWTIGDDGIDESSHCIFDHLTIEERNSSDINVTSKLYCQSMPKPLNTTNTVVLKFKSDFSDTASGFHLEYEIQGCGGTMNRPVGNFTSPNYPKSYPYNTHCQWVIEVDYGHLIEITLHDFDFETNSEVDGFEHCELDGLIFSSDANATKVLNKYCGSIHNHKVVFTSNSNKVYVRFYSDVGLGGRGFSASYKSIAAKCGGIFASVQGNITSPNYPMNYAANTYCQWLLRTEPSHSVLFKFSDFDLEDDCSSDSVQVYDGSEKRADKLLLKSCGSQNIGTDSGNSTSRPGFTRPLKSTGNEMLIVMEADHGIQAKGFAASYSTACGSKIVTASNGKIEIGSNLRWTADNCEWTITAADPNQHVSLNILHLDNEPVVQKFFDNVSNATCTKKIFIYDGTSTSAPKVAEICSSRHPPAIVSESNSLTIVTSETQAEEYAFTFDFRAYYTVLDNECGGDFSSVIGQIASPGYPKTYPNNVDCEWKILASRGNEMRLNIEMLDIDETEHCNGDYLEIRKESGTGELIGIYCGKNIPSSLPPANIYWMKFRSDNDGVGRGFLLEYSYADIVELTGTNGVITSPLYPSYVYELPNRYQRWRITVQHNYVIRIIVDSCILKRASSVRFYDGYDVQPENLIEFIVADGTEDSILSTSNVMMIEFEIQSMSDSRFKLLWSEVARSDAEFIVNVTNTMNCSANSVITVNDGDRLTLQSPGYPNGYAHNLRCVWTFLPAKPGYHVDVAFSVIDLEAALNCEADYIRVGSGKDLQNIDLEDPMCQMSQVVRGGRYHGAPNLRVKFQSDYSNNRTGFSSVVKLDCGGLLESLHGEITSEMTVSNRSDSGMNETCNWVVTVNRGRTIQFEFDKLNLVKNSDGSCNSYIIIWNGIHEDSPFLGAGKYCNEIIRIPATSSNTAIVQFFRNQITQQTNEFVLKYQQIEHECGGPYTLDHNMDTITLSTPNYPNVPNPHVECVWRITAPNGELLKLEFVELFDLETTPGCTGEYVEVREGTTSTAAVIGKYCSRSKPPPIFSSSNLIRITYFTDISVPKNGFKAKVSLARCGKSIMANDGFITSPGFPAIGAYPTGATCDYHLSGRIGSTLNITFLSLDLPEATNCSEVDHIIIYSVVRSTISEPEQIICGTTIPNSIITYSSNALIRFITKSSNHLNGGFRLKFEPTVETCGSRTRFTTGIIESPGYPKSRDSTKYCDWLIVAPKGKRIKLEVLDFDVRPVHTSTASPLNQFPINSDLTFITLYNDAFVSYITTINYHTPNMRLVYSSDNIMGISSMMRRSNFGYRGFKLRYSSDEPSICRGNLNGDSGTIFAPQNATRFYCEYERDSHAPFIQSQPNVGTLAIKIYEEVVTTNRSGCIGNLLTGITLELAPNDQRIYYTKCPPKYDNLVSPFPEMKLILRNTMFRKYHFSYKVHGCGGILTDENTRIEVPTFPMDYGELDCAWQYTTNTERNIRMIINSPAMNCETEYLNIYRGKTSNFPRVTKICGDSVISSRSIIINGQNTYVEYHIDNYKPTASGLQIQIETSDGICGGVIDPPNYIFSSPQNGSKYPSNVECEWIIRARNGYHIGLTFVKRFNIEQSPSCRKDFVQIFDKVNGEFREIRKICGRDFPRFVNSTGPEMKVVFRTDGDVVGDGFVAAWNENCGGVFKATNKPQYITSPRFPDPYPKNAYCNYSIVGNEGESVTVKFLQFDLEGNNHLCHFDKVTIYKYAMYGWSEPMEEVGTYCMNGSLTTFRYTQRIDVVFRTDSFIERSGFKFVYSTDQCGGNITKSTQIGSIKEDESEVYLPLTTCVWFVTAPNDMNILVRFEEFDLEYLVGCPLDYVEVFEGHRTIDNRRKARLCGNLTEHAPAVSIDSNKATIKFATDATVQEKGFTALIMFTKNCNEYINLTTSNPRYNLNKISDQYESLLNCEYFITAPKGYVIQAKFNQMDLIPCTTTTATNLCTCDYLNVRDGSGPFAELFGTFCGHATPPDLQSTTGNMYMRFVTDSVSQGSGFSVSLEMIESPCGQTNYHLNSTFNSIQIQSPMNGGNLYKPNTNCLWIFTTDDGKLIDIKFDQFDLQEDPNNKCNDDYVEIADEETKSIINEGLGENSIFSGTKAAKNEYFYWGKLWPTAAHRYCGSGIPIDYLSTHRKIYVRFKTNEEVEKTGFKLTASIFNECSRNYTALQGRLCGTSLTNCEQFIHVPENYTITLYFSSMEFRPSDECNDNNMALKVYDARNNELLEKYCSDTVPPPLFTSSNFLRLKFQNISLAYTMNDLYDINYLASDKGRGCGGEIFNYGGVFTSPGYPNSDRNNSDCTWTINVPMNLFVAVHFLVFDMGSRATCELNYVEIIEKDPNIAPTKFCGKDEPAPYKAKTNQLKIHFKSSTRFSGSGFAVSFMSVHENSILNRF